MHHSLSVDILMLNCAVFVYATPVPSSSDPGLALPPSLDVPLPTCVNVSTNPAWNGGPKDFVAEDCYAAAHSFMYTIRNDLKTRHDFYSKAMFPSSTLPDGQPLPQGADCGQFFASASRHE